MSYVLYLTRASFDLNRNRGRNVKKIFSPQVFSKANVQEEKEFEMRIRSHRTLQRSLLAVILFLLVTKSWKWLKSDKNDKTTFDNDNVEIGKKMSFAFAGPSMIQLFTVDKGLESLALESQGENYYRTKQVCFGLS